MAYGRGAAAVRAIDEVTLEIAPGEFIAVVGPSGCGKSSLLRLISGLHPPASGTLLVEEQELGLVHQRAAQRGALLHAAGQFPGKAVLVAFEADRFQELARLFAVLPFFTMDAAAMRLHNLERQQHVVDRRAPGQQVGILERHADRLERAGDRLAFDGERAAGRRMQAGDEPQERALAAARGPDHGDELAVRDLQADFLDCLERGGAAAISHRDLLELDQTT